MNKLFLITLCLAVALFLLPGVMASEGWGETLEISGEVTVAEEETPDEPGEGIDGEDNGDEGSDSSGFGILGSGNKAPQPQLIEPNTSGADYSWTVTMSIE
jgi:hypothetical protein